jgi:hypothetical protein
MKWLFKAKVELKSHYKYEKTRSLRRWADGINQPAGYIPKR